jgi:hypothetical protein
MPTQKSTSGRTFTRHIAPFAPLALALGMNLVPSNNTSAATPAETQGPSVIMNGVNIQAQECDDNIADFQQCHENYPTGCSGAGKYDAYLNYLKNLLVANDTGVSYLDQAAFGTLNSNTPTDLGKNNNHLTYKDQLAGMGEGKRFGLVGYLYYYEHTGAESSNCELTGTAPAYENVDFHIGIGFDQSLTSQVNTSSPDKPPKQLEQQAVIVEMTPHYRGQFHPNDWSLASLKPALGHKVRIIGQLLVDSEHNKPSDNCALEGKTAHCWRYSIWELHPVTSFEYCADDSCTEATNNWIPIGNGSPTNAASGNSAVDSGGASNGARKPRSSTRSAAPRSDQAAQP